MAEVSSEEKNHDHWVWKRRFMFVTTAFFMFVIVYTLEQRGDTEVARTASWLSFLGIMANVGAYVFGASWEDILMARTGLVRTNSSFQPSDRGTSTEAK